MAVNIIKFLLLLYCGITLEKTIHLIPYIPLETYLEKNSFESFLMFKISLKYF